MALHVAGGTRGCLPRAGRGFAPRRGSGDVLGSAPLGPVRTNRTHMSRRIAASGALNSFDGDIELDERNEGAHWWSYQGEREALPLKVTPQGHIEGLWWEALDHVYVIAFCEGGSGGERGYYANRADMGDEGGTWVDVIVAFECEEDARRHVVLLEANMGREGGVELTIDAVDPKELRAAAASMECSCSLQSRGTLLLPPARVDVGGTEDARRALERLFCGEYTNYDL